MRLLLVRHGESVANATGIYQGWFDSPLSARGERQIAATARALAARDDIRPTALYASPLSRAWRTGAAIGKEIGLPPVSHDGLREIDVGAATGLPFATVRERWPMLESDRLARGLDHGWPGGETGRGLGARVAATLEEIIARHERPVAPGTTEEAVILASHGGTIRFALAYLRGDTANIWPNDTVDNCGVSEAVIDAAGRRVVVVNGCEHLEGDE